MRTSHIIGSALLLTAALITAGTFIGCEDEPAMSDVGAFFAANEYQSTLREDGSVALVLSPLQGSISVVGERISFRAKGAVLPVTWSPASRDVGTLTVVGLRSDYAIYKALAVGPNTVLAVDAAGRTATASISVGGDALRILPSEVTLVQPPLGDAVAFVVTGGTPPYGEWVESFPDLGTVSPGGVYSVVASGVGAVGTNLITITDAAGDYANATVAHVLSAEDPEIIPSTISIATNGETAYFIASGGYPPYSWSRVYPSRGHIVGSTTGSLMTYQRDSSGDQVIVLTDAAGNTDQATITQPVASALVISPSTITLGTNTSSYGFAVTGGTPNYTWSLISGTGTIYDNNTSAIYERIGNTPTNAIIQVTDDGSPQQSAVANITLE
jgi:hypothetical protein